MADLNRVNGTVFAASLYGYAFKAIKIARANVLTADTVNGTTLAITEGGYSKAMKAIMQCGTIVIACAQDGGDDYVSVIVDGSTFNDGPGVDTAGAFGALKDALISEIGGVAGNYTISSGSTLNADGTITYS